MPPRDEPIVTLRPGLQSLCDVLLAVTAALATAALCLQYGFYRPPVDEQWLHLTEWAVLGLFLLNRLIGLAGSPHRRHYLHENWFDMLVVVGVGAVAMVVGQEPLQYQAVAVGNIYVIITLLYVLVSWTIQSAIARLLPLRILGVLAVSLACLLLLATGLLMLPKAALKDVPLNLTTALFTATACASNTGLAVRDIGGDLSLFGQLVVLVTMQLGALAILSLGTLAVLLMAQGLSSSPSPLLTALPASDPKKVLRLAAIYTLCLEAVGAALLYPMFASYGPEVGTGINVFRSIFHSVSAFSNTGLSLQIDGLQPLADYWQVMGVIAPLVLLGGLGLPILHELLLRLMPARRRESGLSLHSKLILLTLVAVIVLGSAVLIWNEFYSYPGETFGAALSYQDNTYRVGAGKVLAKLPMTQQIREAIFQVTARSTGFATIDPGTLSDGGKMLLILYAFIGGCPAGLGGGVKLGVLAILCLNMYHGVRGRSTARTFGSGMSWNLVRVAAAVALAQFVLVVFDALLVSMFMTGRRLATTGQTASCLDLFLDANSACCNAGVSSGLTANLSQWALVALVGGMFVGRFLSLTVVALVLRQSKRENLPAQDQLVLP